MTEQAARAEAGLPAARVLVVDDNKEFRTILGEFFKKYWPTANIWTAGDGDDAVRRCSSLAPDLVLMDITMPRMDGVEATRQVKAVAPQAHVVMLTIRDSPQDVMAAIRAGADGYITKDTEPRRLMTALADILDGGAYVVPKLAKELLSEFGGQGGEVAAPQGDEALRQDIETKLTPREFDVLKMVARGLSNREAGEQLGIAENTIKVHLAHILDKLHLRNRQQVAALATQAGVAGTPSDEDLP
jgi:DNA-binding NarL/FixJ family response regulator